MTARFTDQALEEVDEARRWYDRRRPGLGDDFAIALDEAVESLLENPRGWPREESVRTAREVRFRVLSPFSDKVVFEVRPEEIVVLAIAHLRKRPGYWKHRRG